MNRHGVRARESACRRGCWSDCAVRGERQEGLAERAQVRPGRGEGATTGILGGRRPSLETVHAEALGQRELGVLGEEGRALGGAAVGEEAGGGIPAAWGCGPHSHVTLRAARRAPAPLRRGPDFPTHRLPSAAPGLPESSLTQRQGHDRSRQRLSLSAPWVVAESRKKQPGWTQKKTRGSSRRGAVVNESD